MDPILTSEATPGAYLTAKGRAVHYLHRLPSGGARLKMETGDEIDVGPTYLLTPVAVQSPPRWTAETLQGQTRETMERALPDLDEAEMTTLRMLDTRQWVAFVIEREIERRAEAQNPAPTDEPGPVLVEERPIASPPSSEEPSSLAEEVSVDAEDVSADEEPDEDEDARLRALSDLEVRAILDKALAEVRDNIHPSDDVVMGLVDDALVAREHLHPHLRPLLDLLESSAPPTDLWNRVRAHLVGALRVFLPSAVPNPIPAPAEAPLPDTTATAPEPPAAEAVAPLPTRTPRVATPSPYGQAQCPICGRTVNLVQREKLGHHNHHPGERCEGAGNTAAEAQAILAARPEKEARPLALPHAPSTSAVIAGPLPDADPAEAPSAPLPVAVPIDSVTLAGMRVDPPTQPFALPAPMVPDGPFAARIREISEDLRVVEAAMPHLLAAEAAVARLASNGVSVTLSARLSPPATPSQAPSAPPQDLP